MWNSTLSSFMAASWICFSALCCYWNIQGTFAHFTFSLGSLFSRSTWSSVFSLKVLDVWAPCLLSHPFLSHICPLGSPTSNNLLRVVGPMWPFSVGNTRVWQHKHVEELQIAPDQTTNGQPNLAPARVCMYMTCFLYEVICFEVIWSNLHCPIVTGVLLSS